MRQHISLSVLPHGYERTIKSNTKNYSNFINSYIAADGNNLGYEKIIKTLKNRFFN